MSLLTDQEICMCWVGIKDPVALGGNFSDSEHVKEFAHAIETEVIKKLATVSVEPAYSMEFKSGKLEYFTREQLAAARVQAIEEAAKVADKFSSSSQYKTQRNLAEWIAKDTRALIGGKQ